MDRRRLSRCLRALLSSASRGQENLRPAGDSAASGPARRVPPGHQPLSRAAREPAADVVELLQRLVADLELTARTLVVDQDLEAEEVAKPALEVERIRVLLWGHRRRPLLCRVLVLRLAEGFR